MDGIDVDPKVQEGRRHLQSLTTQGRDGAKLPIIAKVSGLTLESGMVLFEYVGLWYKALLVKAANMEATHV